MVQAVLTLTPRIVLYSSEYTYYVINSLLIEFILFYFAIKKVQWIHCPTLQKMGRNTPARIKKHI